MAQLEMLVRTLFSSRPINWLVGWLIQEAPERIDAAYQAKPGQGLQRA